MCGICGIVSLGGALAPDLRLAIGPMTDALAHRGPDGDGFFSDLHTVLGHRRLAIIDREGGRQPMTNEDGSRWIVFNGEIYNHRDLRRQLESKGHRFQTASDTEVILHAYEEFGTDCVSRLEGMFAFAIYNTASRSLFAARDRVGKKPFFYAVLGGAFHFGSEIKSLAQSPVWDDTWDQHAIEGYLSLGYVVAPETIYRHVKKLEAGHWLRLQDGRIETQKYWDIEQLDDDTRPESVVLEELEELLRHAVAERLESEVPLGAFLSGGIDSSLVVSLMSQVMANPPTTVTVGFLQKDYNELEAAFATARALNTRHHSHVLKPDILAELDQIISAFDEPFADSSAVPTFYVARAARNEVTVALTGDGGDEGFSGYQRRYVPLRLEMRMRRLLGGGAGQSVAGWLGAHWPRDRRIPKPLRLGSLLDNLGRDPAHAYYADLCFLKPWIARELVGGSAEDDYRDSLVYDRVTEPYHRCPSSNALQRAQYADLKVYLANDVLVKVDRMSMASGLEVRCPLLDRKVLEFAFRIPAERKMPRLQTKHLLRQLALRRLSKELASRPKRGFEAPVEQWIAGNFGHQLAADLFGPNAKVQSVLDSARLRRLYDAHQTRAADNSYVLWSAWVLERWMRLGSKSGASAPPRREHGAVVLDHRERMTRSAAAARS